MSRRPKTVTVNDKMQRGYHYVLVAPPGRNFDSDFRPDLRGNRADAIRLDAPQLLGRTCTPRDLPHPSMIDWLARLATPNPAKLA